MQVGLVALLRLNGGDKVTDKFMRLSLRWCSTASQPTTLRGGPGCKPHVLCSSAHRCSPGLDDDDLSDLEDFLVFNPGQSEGGSMPCRQSGLVLCAAAFSSNLQGNPSSCHEPSRYLTGSRTCLPLLAERDYDAFFKRHFWQARGSDSEEEEEEKDEAGAHEEGQGEEDPAAEERAGTGAGQAAGQGAGEPAELERQAACQRQPQRQRQQPPAKPRDRARPAAKQQQPAAREEQCTMAGSVAAAAAAAGAAAAAKRQGSGHAGSKAHPKRKQ